MINGAATNSGIRNRWYVNEAISLEQIFQDFETLVQIFDECLWYETFQGLIICIKKMSYHGMSMAAQDGILRQDLL